MDIFLEEKIKKFFFRAMMAGWVNDDKKTTIANMPGYKQIPFREGNFFLLDRYCVNHSSQKSAGTTTIWFENNPVWVMNYNGFYDKCVFAFLKSILCRTYTDQQFYGGRGPFIYIEGSLIYINELKLNDFSKFEGHEKVIDMKFGLRGEHEFSGMSLL